jgi:hypothetical protein
MGNTVIGVLLPLGYCKSKHGWDIAKGKAQRVNSEGRLGNCRQPVPSADPQPRHAESELSPVGWRQRGSYSMLDR